jgi:hypothetical protein
MNEHATAASRAQQLADRLEGQVAVMRRQHQQALQSAAEQASSDKIRAVKKATCLQEERLKTLQNEVQVRILPDTNVVRLSGSAKGDFDMCGCMLLIGSLEYCSVQPRQGKGSSARCWNWLTARHSLMHVSPSC